MSNGVTHEKPVLAQVRRRLLEIGASEQVEQDDPMFQGLFEQMQSLRTEMNEAKKEAAAKAAEPYMEALNQIEKRYSMYLKLRAVSTR